MTRTIAATLSLLAALAASAAGAQAPSGGVPLRAGDVVRFDLSQLPRRYEGTGRVVCRGAVLAATGPEESVCDRTYRFEVPPGGARTTYVFRAASGGRESRVEVPLIRESRPISFTAPADGTIQPGAPVEIPAEAVERAARSAAQAECGRCRGRGFQLEAFEVTDPPRPVDGAGSIRLDVTRREGSSG
ncbi:MAG TPA: hypothetical protein VLS93_15795 [Anaeromyxobacteraceae bacterium]|nr:hypothetical protein [Anaeromyxobacteraceae bacterium]